jgi:thiol:disulfide interchange protein DsbD
MIAQSTSIQPGTPFLLAVQFRMLPDWHIYWKNPGDTGLPTTVSWDLPRGFSAGDIMWPTPRRFVQQGLASYGYDGEFLLLARVTPSADLPPGNVTLRASITWLACRVECTPGKTVVSLSLPVRGETPRPDTRWEALFQETESMVPTAASGVSFSASLRGGKITLHAVGISPAPDSQAYFAPSKPDIFAHEAPQNFRIGPNWVTVEMESSKTRGAYAIRGVLVIQDKSELRGIDVDTTTSSVGANASTSKGSYTALIALVLAFVGGLILNLMPCVLPVISLKVLAFVRSSHEGRGGVLRHGLLFAAGVLVSFWAIAGVLVALRAGGQLVGWGFQFQSPAVVAITASLFFLIALNLLDVFEVRFPVRLTGSSGDGAAGSFLSGLLATAVATPCTAPFMGGALGYGLTQPVAVGFGVFTALALGLAAPYVVLSAWPGLVRRIPKPGPWMVTLRQVLAFPMLAAVIWMMYVLETLAGFPAVMRLLSSLLLAGLGVWILGRWGGLEKSARSRFISANLAAILVLGGTAFTAVRMVGMSVPSGVSVGQIPSSSWEPWSPDRVTELQAAGTPVFVDFTARWCLTCQVNERVALKNPAVEQAFRAARVATLRADWTDRSDAIARTLTSFGRAGVPVYALYARGSTSPELLPELLTPGIVLEAVKKLH